MPKEVIGDYKSSESYLFKYASYLGSYIVGYKVQIDMVPHYGLSWVYTRHKQEAYSLLSLTLFVIVT